MSKDTSDTKRLILVVGLWVVLTVGFVHADDWVTTDGKSYQNVSVVKVEADAVTIIDKYGGALVPLDTLPPDLQRRFHYDPVKAKTAAEARARQDAADALALEQEKEKASELKKQQMIKDAKAIQSAQSSVAGQSTK